MFNVQNMIPKVDKTYVPCAVGDKLKTILSTKRFFPILLTGETGTGKTFPVVQTAAQMQRPCFRVNLSKRSNELNLLGGFRIRDGATVFEFGPVVEAMRCGGVLLLDEIDAADPEEILCLQSVMEGKGIYIKEINVFVESEPGFTVVATANTKGLGDETGKYIGTNILNEAFLERFSIALEVDYLDEEQEKKVLIGNMRQLDIKVNDAMKLFADNLIKWAQKIRETAQKSSELSHTISTRRLIHIINTFSIFGGERESIVLGLSRFDEQHKVAFLAYWDDIIKVDAEPENEEDSDNYVLFKDIKPIP